MSEQLPPVDPSEQYPQLQETLGVNGQQAAEVVEAANRINNAQDMMARHPNLDPAMAEEDIAASEETLEPFLGEVAARNLLMKPFSISLASESSKPRRQRRRPRGAKVVGHDGQIVPYGEMARAIGEDKHPEAGRIVRGN